MIVTGRNEDEDTMTNDETETDDVVMMKNLMVTGIETETETGDTDDTAMKKTMVTEGGIGTGMKKPMRIVKTGEGGVGRGTRGIVGRVETSQRNCCLIRMTLLLGLPSATEMAGANDIEIGAGRVTDLIDLGV